MNCVEQFVIALDNLSWGVAVRLILYVIALSTFARLGLDLGAGTIQNYKEALSRLFSCIKKKDR